MQATLSRPTKLFGAGCLEESDAQELAQSLSRMPRLLSRYTGARLERAQKRPLVAALRGISIIAGCPGETVIISDFSNPVEPILLGGFICGASDIDILKSTETITEKFLDRQGNLNPNVDITVLDWLTSPAAFKSLAKLEKKGFKFLLQGNVSMEPLTENCQIYRGSLFVQHPDSRLAKAYQERARAVSAATVSGITAVPKALFFPTHFLED